MHYLACISYFVKLAFWIFYDFNKTNLIIKLINDIQNLLMHADKNIVYIRKWCENLGLKTDNLFDNE